ncbi:MAG TPA: HAMP domain-containing sensor histidine kinase [Bacteroidota bacterium]|nr:HAMP domain-containing sensor histidine kinase [Bacteroidota bacterium]
MAASSAKKNQPVKKEGLWQSIKNLPIKYPAVISGYIIYIYLFMTIIRFYLMAKHTQVDVWDAIEIFDALPFMWLLALTLVKVIEIRTKLSESETQRALKERELQIRETQLKTMHELKNPFAAISGFATILAEDDEIRTMPEQREVVKYIVNAGESALSLINDVFDTNAIESGRLRLTKTNFQIVPMVESAVKAHHLIARAKNISMTIEAEAARAADMVYGDLTRIRQALDNFISNAIKYSTRDKQITIRLQKEKTDVKIEVIDQGQGIPLNEMPNLFHEYTRTSIRPTAGESSTGFGLGIVKKIISEHGGKVGATSEFGKGSIFYFTLPLKEVRSGKEA